MVRLKRSFDVSKPVDVVVDYLVDFAHAVAWDPGTKSCRPTGSGPIAVGSTWHNVSVFRGKETELTYRLVEREARRLVFEGTNKSATSTDDMSFDALPAGGTRITYRAKIEFHGLVKLFGWAVQREFNRLGDLTEAQMTRVINALKL